MKKVLITILFILLFTTMIRNTTQVAFGRPNIHSWKVWKTITLGTYQSITTLHNALEVQGNHVSPWANDILNKILLYSKKTCVDLVIISVADLGFKEGATYKDILVCATNLGLKKCPAEVGPQLRLQYKNQLNGEWLRIAMEPIIDSEGHPSIFGVGRSDSGLWLYWDGGNPGDFWRSNNHFVFVR